MAYKWSPTDNSQLAELYLASTPVDDLASKFGVSRNVIYAQCRKLKLSRTFQTDEQTDVIRRRKETSQADWPSDWPKSDPLLTRIFREIADAGEFDRMMVRYAPESPYNASTA